MNFFSSYVSPSAQYAVASVLIEGRLSEGEIVRRFEKNLEDYLGFPNIVAVNSGTSALHLALLAAGVQPGDEVILPPLTFIATGFAVLYCGATPVFCDINPDGCISISAAQDKITKRTKAIIGVNWAGHPCNIKALEDLGNLHGCKIIIDAAQSFGTGIGGDFTCLSFQATKHLTTGDGGAVICKDRVDYENVRRLSWFGIDKEKDLPDILGERVYNLADVGFKYHMNNIAAAIGIENLKGIEDRTRHRGRIAEIYKDNLAHVEPLHFQGAFWAYPIKTQNVFEFSLMCHKYRVPVSNIHAGIDLNVVFRMQPVPIMRLWERTVTHLPIHHEISEDDALWICEQINQFS